MTKQIKVTHKAPNGDDINWSFEVEQWPADINEAIEMWGEVACFQALIAQVVVKAQASARALAVGNKSTEPVSTKKAAEMMAGWTLKEARQALSPAEKAAKMLASLSDEEKAAILKSLG